MEKIFFIGGGIIFILILFFFLKKKFKKKNQVVFAIKKITKCKDKDCFEGYEIQGVPNKNFRTFEEAKQYALFLKNRNERGIKEIQKIN